MHLILKSKRLHRWKCFSSTLILFSGITLGLAQSPADFRTPPPGPKPHINGPKIYGARPSHPFLYRIPSTGTRPIHFSAKHLPSALHLDSTSGIITGTTPPEGRYHLTLRASNAFGRSERSFTIVSGSDISLTPQMGWNDWYSYYGRITDAEIRQATDAMLRSGMADFGYQFVDIDDCWARKPHASDPNVGSPVRNSDGQMLPNARFPDMKSLTSYIHDRGLKAGIYTSPGPLTCAGYEGSYGHEKQDAQQFAEWGFDLLKYDYCSYGKVSPDKSLASLQRPYRTMGSILRDLDRDVVFNLCQYGKGDVWKWGAAAGGNSWRTTGDLGTERGGDLPGFYRVGLFNAGLSQYAHRGAWNDPDYILIGTVGNALDSAKPPQLTSLTADEQYSYMSMWALMASPLFFSGEVTHLDPFTLNVLCNTEVIDLDQDSLGEQAHIVRKSPQDLVLVKKLEDGSLAVGLFNLTDSTRTITISWQEVGLRGRQKVRDVWRHRTIGSFKGSFSSEVNRHGVTLIRLNHRSWAFVS